MTEDKVDAAPVERGAGVQDKMAMTWKIECTAATKDACHVLHQGSLMPHVASQSVEAGEMIERYPYRVNVPYGHSS
jgi:hypothetical protein